MLFVLFISIYTTRVVLKELGIVDYGIYNVVCGFVSMFNFFNTTMSSCTQRFYSFELGKGAEGDINKIYRTSIIIQLIIVILLLAILETVGLWYVNYKMVIPPDRLVSANWIFQFAILSLVFVVIQVPFSAAIIAYERMDYYAIVSVIDAVLKLIIVLLLPLFNGDKLIYYGFLLVAVSLLNIILYFVYSKRNFRNLHFSLIFHKDSLGSVTSFTGWTLLEMFAWMTQGQGVNMVMNVFLGVSVNAARGVAMQMQNAIHGFCNNLVTAFRPQIIESYAQGNYNRTRNLMYGMAKVMFLFYFIISTPFVIEMDYVLKLWLGDNVPEYTSIFSVLMLVSMYPRNFVTCFSQIVEATGIVRQYHIWSTLVILIMLPSSYVLLKLGFSAPSIYWLNIIVCILLFFVCAFLLKKVFTFSVGVFCRKVLFPCILIASITSFLLLIEKLILNEGLFKFLFICLSNLFATAFLSYHIVLNANEKSLIIKVIKKIIGNKNVISFKK